MKRDCVNTFNHHRNKAKVTRQQNPKICKEGILTLEEISVISEAVIKKW